MVLERFSEVVPVNARKTDAFDVFNFKFYSNANPYLDRGAFVFDWAFTDYCEPLPLDDYVTAIAAVYPHVKELSFESHAHLFAQATIEVGKLDMNLHLERFHVQTEGERFWIAVESLHEPTTRGVVYAVWDWFEAITQNQDSLISEQIGVLQKRFRRSAYGGPTVYALLRSAHQKGIPTFYLVDEGLMQYGYGKQQVRGVATTFNTDSHLDSDFTTRKDDCKAFLDTLGFPVPQGSIVTTIAEAWRAAERVGYPVAVKPVVGHKGIGVTAEVQDDAELEFAFNRAVDAHPDGEPVRVIVEQNIFGMDFRLLCINGKFVAATERHPATVIGDGRRTIAELIDQENATAARLDTPTSPLGKIIKDHSLERFLAEQRLTLDSIPERDEKIFLRKVANLSSGGVSINATDRVHPDTIILAQDIAQHFSLVCLGIDVLTPDISRSWKEGEFGIVEINSAPGVYMHLRPAVGDSVDVAGKILDTFFSTGAAARIPIISINRIARPELLEFVDHILTQHPTWTIGAICRSAAFINRSEKPLSGNYNTKVHSLLRNPRLDLLIAEYDEATLEQEGCFYDGSNLVILDNPTDTELMLARDLVGDATVVIKQGNQISRRYQGLVEQYELGAEEPFQRVYWKEISTIVPEKG